MASDCIHGLKTHSCAICNGQITAANQTRDYGEIGDIQEERPDKTPRPAPVQSLKDAGKTSLDEEKRLKAEEVAILGKKKCKVNGCDRPARIRGICGRHYSRWRAGAPELEEELGKWERIQEAPREPIKPKIPIYKNPISYQNNLLIILNEKYPELVEPLEVATISQFRSDPIDQAFWYIYRGLKMDGFLDD